MDFSFDLPFASSNPFSSSSLTQTTAATEITPSNTQTFPPTVVPVVPVSPTLTHATAALATLPTLLSTATAIIELLSSSSASLSTASLTTEDPDYGSLKRQRTRYDALKAELGEHVRWLDQNAEAGGAEEKVEDTDVNRLRETRDQLRKESADKTRTLKRMLDQSYALQFQIATLLTSAEEVSVGETELTPGRAGRV